MKDHHLTPEQLAEQLACFEYENDGAVYAPKVVVTLDADGNATGLSVGMALTVDDETRELWMSPDTDGFTGEPGVGVRSGNGGDLYRWEDLD